MMEKWEFECDDKLEYGELQINNDQSVGLYNEDLDVIVREFIGLNDTKIRISCKDGEIRIRRVR